MLGRILVVAIRLTVLVAMGGVVAACLVPPINPDQSARRAAARSATVVVARSVTDGVGLGLQLLDADTARMEKLDLPGGIFLDLASLSPWEARGQRQLVGVGRPRAGAGGFEEGSRLEMIRMTVPGGEVLDRLPFDGDPLPNGAPCWAPGGRARLIYPGSDGRIYALDFEPAGADDGARRPAEICPRELPAEGFPAQAGEAFVSDLSWDATAQPGRRLLASLRFQGGKASGVSGWQLWWLQLDQDATRITAAGRLLDAEAPSPHVRRRFPTAFRDHTGAPRLAYLSTRVKENVSELRVVPIRLDPVSEAPHAREADATVLAERCLASAPVPSTDRGNLVFLRESGETLDVGRVSLEETRGSREAAGPPRDATAAAVHASR
ncbi:hypothetical protein OJF2_48180 [Aquisphaera giovannonii]|uniref:Phytase-like domain-containing protein n=1 Tax=Aquisphaera giovannonii TaxID=406548 RepID=A0A5B9W6T0_9BACT|nr:hypothetical protein [Aquisphaera giovannonii]QEH36258.1 hypothetical protein OJF2_48180 [Aquisphaera giovannonii]